MISVLEKMSEIGAFPALTLIILFCLGVREAYGFVVWLLELLNIYHKKKDEAEDIADRIKRLEKHDTSQYEMLQKMETSLDELTKSFKDFRHSDAEKTIALYGSTLYEMYEKASGRGYVTRAEAETFGKLSEYYLAAGGNHMIKSVIIPGFDSLPIKD